MNSPETNNSSRDLLKRFRQSLSFKLGLTVGLIFLVAVLALPEQTMARWEAAIPGAQAETWGEEPEGGWSNDPDPWSDDDWEDE